MASLYFLAFFLVVSGVFSANNININPGDDIQSAIDTLHKNAAGGTLIFNKGTYIITKSIIVYSNITLQGNKSLSATDVIISVDPKNLKFNEPLLTIPKTNDKIENINLINFSLLGNIQPSEQKYPAFCLQCSRNCTGKKPSDPGCSCLNECPSSMRTGQTGITTGGSGTSIDTAQYANFVLRDLIVSHCAMGIAFGGWKNVILDNIHAFDNGMIQEYFHNIYLRRNFNITISNVKSHNSPTGNGINISQSSIIVAFLSIFENNYWRGLRIEGEENYIVHDFNVYNNTCDNDGDYGFRFANAINGIVKDNVARNNTPSNCYKGNLKNVTFTDNIGF